MRVLELCYVKVPPGSNALSELDLGIAMIDCRVVFREDWLWSRVNGRMVVANRQSATRYESRS